MTSHLTPGSPAFRAALIGLFAAGFGTFVALYCVQPLLPHFAEEFGLSPTGASLALSAATGALAVSILGMSGLADRFGRKGVMAASLFATGVLTLAAAAWPGWTGMLVLRALTGIALSGVPAVAIAYLGEEVDRKGLPHAMSLYISGTAIGGLSGRLFTGIVVDLTGSWRLALVAIGVMVLLCGVALLKLLPASRHFQPSLSRPLSEQAAVFLRHMQDGVLMRIFAVGFLLLGGFVVIFNYTGFRLLGPPYHLTESLLGALFLAYLMSAPATASMGRASLRFGRAPVMIAGAGLMLAGILLTLAPQLPVIVLGLAVFTFGFFGNHALAGAWVTERATVARSQASALYMFFYYLGSTLLGPLGGQAWSGWGWPGVVGLLVLAALLTGALAASLSGLSPRAP